MNMINNGTIMKCIVRTPIGVMRDMSASKYIPHQIAILPLVVDKLMSPLSKVMITEFDYNINS